MPKAVPGGITTYSGAERGGERCGEKRGYARLGKRCADQAAPICRIALLIEYLGKNFHGSQSQKNERTVQSVLEKALGIWLRLDHCARVIFSGRTDSGVHALGQVAHFDLPIDYVNQQELNMQSLCWVLNGILPADLSVRAATPVDSTFHARFTAIERKYVYRILNHKQRSPIFKDSHYFIRQPLNVDSMQEAIACLPGSHDFAAFKSRNSDCMTTVCNVSNAQLLHLDEGELEFSISANHFVYNMVRIITGTVIEIGLNKRGVSSLELALKKCERQLAGPTAPAWGLCLTSVKYPPPYTDIFANRKVREINSENLQCIS